MTFIICSFSLNGGKTIKIRVQVLGRGTFGKVVLCREKKNQVLYALLLHFQRCARRLRLQKNTKLAPFQFKALL